VLVWLGLWEVNCVVSEDDLKTFGSAVGMIVLTLCLVYIFIVSVSPKYAVKIVSYDAKYGEAKWICDVSDYSLYEFSAVPTTGYASTGVFTFKCGMTQTSNETMLRNLCDQYRWILSFKNDSVEGTQFYE
jgi:hypothetical protein